MHRDQRYAIIQSMYDTCVIGGGLAGLTSAYRLSQDGHRVVLLERNAYVGGRIRTLRDRGATIETGASFFAGFYSEVNRLVSQAGIAVDQRSDSQETWLCKSNGEIAPIWPAKTLLHSDAISVLGKLRAARGVATLTAQATRLDSLMAGAVLKYDDQNIEQWCRKHFGTEAYLNIIDPLLRSLFFWNPAQTTRALLPLIVKGVTTDRNFYRVAGGMSVIPEQLAMSFEYRTETRANAVTLDNGNFMIATSTGPIRARSVILACAGPDAKVLLNESGISVSNAMERVTYTSVSVGVIRLRDDVAGFEQLTKRTIVFSADTRSPLIAVKPVESIGTSTSRYLRFYWESVTEDDASILTGLTQALIDRNLEDLADGVVRGELIDLVRWHSAIPEFGVGSLLDLDRKAAAAGLPAGITLAGDYMVAPHLEGAVQSGVDAANQTVSFLRLKK